jgi:aryl-alcohol dehydrogenase-like predicted oxidoreductase
VEAGLTRAVGVSNYSRGQMQRTCDVLAKRGIKLTSNQVEYNLLKRNAERSGLLARCQEIGIRLIAYSPLGMGLLTGKYTPDNLPPGIRRRNYYGQRVAKVQPLIKLMREIGEAHGGKIPAQVALNWTICKGALPIPGAKNAQQVAQNAGARGWQLTDEEIARLDEASDQLTRG